MSHLSMPKNPIKLVIYFCAVEFDSFHISQYFPADLQKVICESIFMKKNHKHEDEEINREKSNSKEMR